MQVSTHVVLVVSGVIPATSVVVLQSAFGPMYGVLGCCVQSSDQCGAPIVQRVLGESVGGIEVQMSFLGVSSPSTCFVRMI